MGSCYFSTTSFTLFVFLIFANAESFNVGVITVPSHGHLKPIITLVDELRERGHHVTLWSTDEVIPKVENKINQFHSLGNTTMEDILIRVLGEDKDEFSLFSMFAIFAEVERIMLEVLLPTFTTLQTKQELPDVLIVDFLTFAGFDIGDVFHIPTVVSFPGIFPPMQYKPNWQPANGEGMSILRRFKGQARNIVEQAFGYALCYHSNQVRAEYELESWRSFPSCLYLDKITFQFGFSPLVEPGPFVTGPRYLLGLPFKPRENATLSPEVLEWIESQGERKIIYVSFGTMARQSSELLEYLVNQFIHCPQYSFVWSLRENIAERNLEAISRLSEHENILRLAWVDQVAILNHVDMFFTHGGYNSLLEGIYAGKPLLCMPFTAEQPENCARAAYLNIALEVDKDDLETDLCPLFERLLTDKLFKEESEMLSGYAKISSKNGISNGIDVLELIAKYGEEALLPLDYGTPYYSRFNWDLYVIQLLCIVVAYLILRCCWNCCCTRSSQKKKEKIA